MTHTSLHVVTYIILFRPTYLCFKIDELIAQFVVDHLERLPSMKNLVGLHNLWVLHRFAVDVWRMDEVVKLSHSLMLSRHSAACMLSMDGTLVPRHIGAYFFFHSIAHTKKHSFSNTNTRKEQQKVQAITLVDTRRKR